MENEENQKQVYLVFHRPLKIPQSRDFQNSTAPGVRRMEKWKTKNRFPTFPPDARDDDGGFLSQKPKKGSRPLRGLLILLSALSLRSSGADFMLIFRLENATDNSCAQSPVHRAAQRHTHQLSAGLAGAKT
ncbi:MAG: hypothetical protein LC126_26095 [Bryobacterales bacterium]|nr:hypothetical protein [Bryobacterales bacterium]